MIERIEAIPFQKPSRALLDMLEFLEEAHRDLYQACQFEFSREELHGLGELTPLQVNRLLMRGKL